MCCSCTGRVRLAAQLGTVVPHLGRPSPRHRAGPAPATAWTRSPRAGRGWGTSPPISRRPPARRRGGNRNWVDRAFRRAALSSLELARQGLILPERLVVVNGALENFRGAAGWLFPIMAKMLALNPFTGLLISQGGRSVSQVRSILSSAGTELSDEGLARYANLIQRRAHVDGTLAMMAQWSLDDLNRALPEIATPTLFVHGERDGAVALRVAERAARTMPDAQLVALPGVGHIAHEEAPERVAEEIARFAGLVRAE